MAVELDGPAAKNTRAALVLSLQSLGIPTTDAVRQRHVVAVWTKGRARRRSELTEREAGSLVARLRTMTRAELADVLARPVPPVEPEDVPGEPEQDGALRSELEGPAPELPADAIVCGPAPVTEGDAAVVRAFAAALDEGPAAVRAFALAEEPPPIADPPADVEAAVEAAAARFRERVAAGIVPEPPDLSSLPPRTPVVLGAPPDRYCLSVCYCGTCEHWAPAPPVDYSKTPGSIAYEEAERWRR